MFHITVFPNVFGDGAYRTSICTSYRKKFIFLPLLELAMVTPVGVTDLVGGVVVEFCSLPSTVCSGGKP
jgi:hypothetical protein